VFVKILAVVVSVVAIGGALAFALPEFLAQYNDAPQSVGSQPAVAPAPAKPGKKCCSSSGNCCCAPKGKSCCCGSATTEADPLAVRAATAIGAAQEPLGPALMLLTAEMEKK
jgi:hypothetical protein